MTRLTTCGWESGNAQEAGWLTTIYTDLIQQFGNIYPRSGEYMVGNTGPYTTIYWVPPSGDIGSEVYLRAGFHSFSNYWGEIHIGTYGGGYTYLQVNAEKRIAFGLGGAGPLATGISQLDPDAWYLFEVYYKRHATEGRYVAKVDGNVEIDYTGNTISSGLTVLNRVWLYAYGFWDDLAINDINGTYDNSWCGDGHVVAIRPTSTPVTGWTGSDGNQVDNHLLVDDSSWTDADYVAAAAVDLVDKYGLEDPGELVANEYIGHVWGIAASRCTVGDGTVKMAVGLRTHNTDYWSADQTLTATYMGKLTDYHWLNPNTGARWNMDELNALQIAIKSR